MTHTRTMHKGTSDGSDIEDSMMDVDGEDADAMSIVRAAAAGKTSTPR